MTGGKGDGRVQMKMKKLFIVLAVLLFSSCRQMDVISDPYWTALFPPLSTSLIKTVKPFVHVYRIHYTTVSIRNGMNELADVLHTDHPRIVLLSPLISHEVEGLREKFPAVHFYYYSFAGDKMVKSQKDTAVAIYGYRSIAFTRMINITNKLVYLIMEKENKREYKDINLENLE